MTTKISYFSRLYYVYSLKFNSQDAIHWLVRAVHAVLHRIVVCSPYFPLFPFSLFVSHRGDPFVLIFSLCARFAVTYERRPVSLPFAVCTPRSIEFCFRRCVKLIASHAFSFRRLHAALIRILFSPPTSLFTQVPVSSIHVPRALCLVISMGVSTSHAAAPIRCPHSAGACLC